MRKTGSTLTVFATIISGARISRRFVGAIVFTAYRLLFTICYLQFAIHSLSAAGSTAAEFLKIIPGVRAAGMGGAFTAVSDDKTAVYYNPAGLSQLRWHEAAASYDKWIMDTSLATLTYAHTFGGDGSSALGVTYYDSGDIEKRSDTKDHAGVYKHTGMAIRAAYGNEFFEGVSLGAAVKYVGESLDGESSAGFAGDIGAHYKTVFDFGETSFGVAAQNIGSKLWDEYDMPLTVRFGAAVKPSRDFMIVAAEYAAASAGVPIAALGLEITPGPLSLRAGYRAGISDVSGLSAVTFGIGYRYTMDYDYIFNYAFSTQGDLGLIHRLEVGFAF